MRPIRTPTSAAAVATSRNGQAPSATVVGVAPAGRVVFVGAFDGWDAVVRLVAVGVVLGVWRPACAHPARTTSEAARAATVRFTAASLRVSRSACRRTGHRPPGPDDPDWPVWPVDEQCDDPAVVTSASVFGVLTVALVLVLTPGPNMMYLVSRSITQGRQAGVISLGGVAVGFLVYLTATNLGLSALFVSVPELYLTVKLAGACYLGWLAVRALRPGGVSVFAPAQLPPDSTRRLFTMGLTTNLLNPKIAVMYLSLIQQF